MKKFFSAIIFVCMLSSFSLASENINANPDDVYVRRDVYNSDMKNIDAKLDNVLARLDTLAEEARAQRENINQLTQAVVVLSERIESVNTSLNDKIENVSQSLNEKIDVVDKRLSDKIESVNTSLNVKIENVSQSLNEKIDAVDKRLSDKIESGNISLNEKIDAVDKRLGEKIDAVDKKLSVRMDDLRNGLYLILTLIAIVVSLPLVKNWYEERAKRKAELRVPSITLQDVKNLIEENNAMLLRKIQGGVI